MDITALFKASVKTVRLRNKSIPVPDKNRILSRSRPKDDFTIKTKDICHQITQLRNLLIENRAAYMRFACHLKRSAQMTDEERDIIDEESEKIIGICTQFIQDLKLECRNKNTPKQASEHMNGILELLSLYLKNVLKIYNEQKAYRIQHELDTYRLLKLEPNKKLIPVRPATDRIKFSNSDSSDDDGEDDEKKLLINKSPSAASKSASNKNVIEEKTGSDKTKIMSEKVAVDEDLERKTALEEDELSAEDIQVFESENVQLYNELKGLADEVEQIEKNVVDIAKLQELFTEKVKPLNLCKT